jgi:hypothetical protein
MNLSLDGIPDKETAPANAQPSLAMTDIATAPAGRRSILRAMALGAMTVGAITVDWSNKLTSKPVYAESGPGGVQGWDRTDCLDAYPGGYAEVRDNVGAHTGKAGACFGATYIGSTYCASGWHRTGTVHDSPVVYYYAMLPTRCAGKGAWKWTAAGTWWRCADGQTTVSGGGSSNTYTTICRY